MIAPLPTKEFIKGYIESCIDNSASSFSVEHGGGAEIDRRDRYSFYKLPFNDGTFQQGFYVSYRNFFFEELFIYPLEDDKTLVRLEHFDLEPGTSRVHDQTTRGVFSIDLGAKLAQRIEEARKKQHNF